GWTVLQLAFDDHQRIGRDAHMEGARRVGLLQHRLHVGLQELAHRLDELQRAGSGLRHAYALLARAPAQAARNSSIRSYSVSAARRPMVHSSTERCAPDKCLSAWIRQMMPQRTVPKIS